MSHTACRIALSILLLLPCVGQTEPTSSIATSVQYVRPYSAGVNGIVFFSVAPATDLCGGASWFMLELDKPGAKSIYAALLAAKAMDKSIFVELSNQTGCNSPVPGYRAVQSIYLN